MSSPKSQKSSLLGTFESTAPEQLVETRQPDSSLKTGNLPDFRTMPFAAELLVKDRWTGLPPIPEGDQA
ncbi:hypothetical protein I204_05601 [Kwoniella mangroviensis CBS 8886]|nr:uncharacterized protein I203_07756 [Kwoniella mangroviensis CBS 8507]OCF63331.1 hypothetical protein I203_07756 [Kwoniella mangroviensis CBS 8507]OCF73757.1 hypothetical protein I204_05601 [Kwoniella mangroviensis CBS 8886]